MKVKVALLFLIQKPSGTETTRLQLKFTKMKHTPTNISIVIHTIQVNTNVRPLKLCLIDNTSTIQHDFDFDNVKIIERPTNWHQRIFREYFANVSTP